MAPTLTQWIFIFTFFNCILLLQSVRQWGTAQLYPPSKIPDNALSPDRSIVRRKVVLYHNFFRSKVKPTASNMLLMSWDPRAGRAAQKYAEKCKFLVHNAQGAVNFPHLGNCGENLFVAAQKTPWFFAIKSWFLEYKDFKYGSTDFDFHKIGHYTQMTWATTHKVGCGIARCSGGPWGHFYNYVCYYCPGGNIQDSIQFPYKAGPSCGDCPNDCIGDKLCKNYCPVKDFYSNCNDLVHYPGQCATGNCNATCSCGSTKIYKNYPWL